MPDGDAWAAFTAAPAATSTVGPVPPVVAPAPASDGWEAFTAPAATSTVGPVPPVVAPAPASDGWEAFTAPAATTQQPPAPTYDEYNAAGQWIGTSDEGYQGPYAKLHVDPPAPKTGYLANAAAGLIEGAGGVLNTFADPVGNLIGKPLAIIGTAAHDALAPYLGYEKFTPQQRNDLIGDEDTPQPGTRLVDASGRVMGAPATADVQPATPGESLTRKVVAAGTGMAALGGGGLLRSATVNPAIGVAGALGGSAAADLAPEEYKPVAELGGNIAASSMIIPRAIGAGVSAIPGASRVGPAIRSLPGVNQLTEYMAPMVGRMNPLVDTAGMSMTGSDGQPLMATTGQRALLAKQLPQMASDPAAVRATLANPPAPLIPGDNPTTAMLTGDPGLAAQEFTASRTGTPMQQAAFREQADAQNDARVRALRGQAADADPMAADAAMKGHAAAADEVTSAQVAAVQGQVAGDVAAADAAGQARVAGLTTNIEAVRARLEAESQARLTALQDTTERTRAGQDAAAQARVAGLQQTAEQRLAAVGGDLPAGSEAQVGASVRAPVKAFDDAARARERDAWEAIDPHGKLVVDMRPVRDGAAAVLAERSSLAKPLEGEEGAIFDTAGQLQDVHTFKDLTALRGRITDQIRKDRIAGNDQSVRRLSMLLGHVHGAMEGSLPDQKSVAILHNRIDAWEDEFNVPSAQTVPNDSGTAGRDAPGRSGALSPVAGAEIPSGGQRERPGAGNSGEVSRLPPGAANEVTPLSGPSRKAETLHDFVISRGGVKDQSGEYAAQDLNRIHHRAGGRLVNNTSGISEDYMREAAVQDGFLPANADINDFRDAMTSKTPVYRISEAHDAATRSAERTQAWQTDEARYLSRDAVAVAADEAGVRLSPAEINHATDLHMQGVHADDAVQQAASATEGQAFDRNAAANAVGSPGVPLTARQADNGLTGASRLEPNFDQAAADRYAKARALTAERKGGFEGAPGIKSILQGGPTAGTFKLPDASIAASSVTAPVIRVGPSGADHVRVYLAKGGTPEALSDAAAFSLRRDAMRPDGTLDPARTAKWAKDRSSFLSALPDAAAKFGDAAAAQRVLEDVTAAEAQAMKASTAVDARTLKDATAAETQALKNRAAADVKTLKAATADAAQALKQATATAEKTVNDAMAARATAAKVMQSSAIGKFLGEADPVAQTWSLINNKAMGAASAQQLARAVQGDPNAVAGLQRAIFQGIEKNIIGTSRGVTSAEAALSNDAFQKFYRNAARALRTLLTPDQMGMLDAINATLERDMRSAQVGVGSATGQIQAAGKRGLVGRVAEQLVGLGVGGAMGAGIGSALFGPVGAGLGSAVGGALGKAFQAGREAGISNMVDLKVEALRNPALFHILLTPVTAANRTSLAVALTNALRRASLISASTQQQDHRQRAVAEPSRDTAAASPSIPNPNGLLPFGGMSSGTASAMPLNQLTH